MGKFTNLEMYVEPDSTLFQPEIDALQAVVDQVLASFDLYPTKGTFILDGQKMGEEAQCILRFNLEDGMMLGRMPCEADSDLLTARAINEILLWPENSCYEYRARAENFGQLPAGIYLHHELEVMVLNTTLGRFLVSFYSNAADQDVIDGADTAVLMALAEALAQMGKEDKILQQSAQQACHCSSPLGQDAIKLVKRLFLECDVPALKAWREWHEPANNSGELTLFFE